MKNKILATILFIVLIIATLNINSFAAGEETLVNIAMDFITETTTIDKNEKTIEFTLSLGEFTGIEENIVLGYEATLEYDENIFESVSVEGLNGWTATYEPSTKVLIGETPTAIGKANTDITKVTFTLKDGLEAGATGTVALNNLTLTDGETNDFEFSKEMTISIEESEQEENGTNENTQNTNTNTNTAMPGNNTDTTTATTKYLPAAGLRNILIIAVVVAIIAMIIFKIKSRDIKY